MPAENDGTVSITSQLFPEAKQDAVSVTGHHEDHVSILSSKESLGRIRYLLDSPSH